MNRKLRLQRGKYGLEEGGSRPAGRAEAGGGACNKWAREELAAPEGRGPGAGRGGRGAGSGAGRAGRGGRPALRPAGL